jgi:ATPase subunit of ABC transporter with duplicated ATPase domains
MALFEIKCPLCKGKLWIDPASGKVVDHQSADHQKGDFEEFLKSRQKGTAWDDRMKKAKEEEAKRKAEIAEKFKKAASEPAEINPDEKPMKSPFDWD